MTKTPLCIILTGGALTKTYCPKTGKMVNQDYDPERIFAGIRLAEFDVRFVDLMQRDSLDMETHDIEAIVDPVGDCHAHGERVLVIVGTDPLSPNCLRA